VTINHSAVDDWPDDFIPSDLQQHVICLRETDHHERAGYTVDLQDRNYENDWQAAEDIPGDSSEDSPLVTGSVTSDINGERQNPGLRLLNAVCGLLSDRTLGQGIQYASPSYAQNLDPSSVPQHTPAIRYTIRGQTALLNHWQDPHYFTSAFPTLFPTGVGCHLDLRAIPVSLAAFADWALRHHSRRQAPL
jgi:hypothetical protein